MKFLSQLESCLEKHAASLAKASHLSGSPVLPTGLKFLKFSGSRLVYQGISVLFSFMLLLASAGINSLSGQTLITSETFDEPNGSTSGTMSGGQPWTASGNNCDGAGTFGTDGAGNFVCNDYEGFQCCDCVGSNPVPPPSSCGDASNTIELGPIDISAWHHISIDVFASQSGDMECAVGGNPNAPCPSTPITGCNGGGDQMVFNYRVNGGPWTVFQYYCGDNALCYAQQFACDIAGSTLEILVTLGTQAASETYLIQNILVYGYPEANAEASANGVPVSTTACANTVINLSETSAVTNSAWSWSGPGLGTPNTENTTATLPSSGTVNYSVTATDQFGCTATSTVEVVIQPVPTVVDPPNQAVCSGQNVSVVFTGTGNPTFNWTNSNPAIGLPASGTGDISYTAPNVATATTGTITVTPAGANCSGTPQTFTITINPGPTVNPPTSPVVCGGQPVSVTFSGSSGATFSWTNDNTSIGLPASGTGNISFTSAVVGTQQVANLTVTPNQGPCAGIPQNFTITINPGPTVTDPPNLSICGGDPVSVTFSSPTSPTFLWTNSNPAIGLPASGTGNINFTAANVATNTTAVITVTPSENGCTGSSQTFIISISATPTVNPIANQTVCGGQAVNIPVSGTSGATFAWANDNTAIGLGASGAGNITFTAASVATQQVANITITPSLGACPGTPITFSVTVNPAPTVVDPPDQTVCAGDPVSVNFSGSPNPTLNWTNSNTAIGLGASGSGDISFTAAGVATTTTGTITVTPSENGCTGPAQTFTITVGPNPVVTPPADQTVCGGQTVNIPLTGTTGATFNWTNSNPAIGLGASGAGSISFTASTLAAPATGTITITPTLGGCTGPTQTFDITVNPSPTMTDPADQIACSGDPVNVIFAGSGNPVFNWTNNNPAIGLPASGSGDINFTAATVGTSTVGTITVTPSENGCTGSAQTFTITISPVPTVTTPANQTVCGGQTGSVTFSGSPGATFSWTNDNPAIGLPASGTGSINFTAANPPSAETATISVTPSLGTCTGTTQIFTITVNPTPSMTDPTDQSVCAGDLVSVIFSGIGNPAFNWTNNNPAIGLSASGSGDISFNAASVASTTVGTITVTPSENGCAGPAQTFTITVGPSPTVNAPANQTICGGQAVNVPITGSSGATFTWTNDNTAIGLPASGSGSINFNAANPASIETATITITPTLGSCTGPVQTFTITVNPAPSVTDPTDQSVCSGDAVSVIFSGTGNPTYNWSNNNLAIGLAASGSGDINFTAAAVATTATGTITVTPIENGCTGPVQTFTITVTATPTVNPVGDQTVCGGQAVNVLIGGTAGTTFSWVNDNPAIGLPASGAGSINFTSANVLATEIGFITITPTIGTCTGTPETFSVTVNPVPTVIDPPNQTVCSGDQVSVIFSGTGNPVYNWTNSNPTIGLPASGSGDIDFTAVIVAGTTTGTIVVTPVENGCSGPSQSFTITVGITPTVNAPTDQSVCGGQPVNVIFTGSTGATFSWTNDNPGIGLPASGTGSINFTSANAITQQTGVITVTPEIGSCAGIPQTFTITVNPSPTVVDPVNQTVCGGTVVSVAFSGTVNPTFNWTNSNTAIGLSANGSGDIDFTAASVVVNTTATITVTPVENGCDGQPQTFTLAVIPQPTVNQPVDQIVCAGGSINVNFTGTPGATFTWTNDNTAIGLAASGSGPIGLTAAPVTSQETANITVTPALGACTGNPVTFTITVNPAPAVVDPPNQTACSGDAIVVNFSGTVNPSFSWTNSNPAIGLPASGNGNIDFNAASVSTLTSGIITVTPNENGCAGPAQTFTISIAPTPFVNIPADQSVCTGEAVTVIFSGTAGATFDWTNSDPSIGLPASGTGNINFTAANIGAVTTAIITVTPVLGSCTGNPETFTITLTPGVSVTNPGDQGACPGDAINVIFTGSGMPTFSWTNSNPAIGLPTSGTGNISFTAPAVASTTTGTITVTPGGSGCAGAPQTFTITISAGTSITPVTDVTACGGTLINVPFSGTPGTSFSWTNSNPNIGLPASGTGPLNFTASNTVETATIIVTPAIGSCIGTPDTFNITTNPAPTVVNPGDQTICSGGTADLVFSGTGASAFNWTNSNPAIGLPASGMGNINFVTAVVTTPVIADIVVTPVSGTCLGAPINFSITVAPAPSITPAPSDLIACAGNIVNSIFGGSTGATYAWINSNPAIGLPASGSGNITFTAANNPSVQIAEIIVTASVGTCVSPIPDTFSITINPAPSVMVPANDSVCSGTLVNLPITGTGGATISWTNSNPAIGLPATGSGNINFTASTTSNIISSTITAIAELGGCTGPGGAFEITVVPTPSVNAVANVAVCNGENVSVSFAGSSGANFSWTNANPAIGLPASGTGNLNFTASPVATVQTATITVTPENGGCTGATQTFTITVSPGVSVNNPGDTTICAGQPLDIILSGTGNPTFSWVNDNTTIGLINSGTGNISFIGNTVNVSQTGTITITPSGTGCAGAAQSFTITVNPVPLMTPPADLSACAGTQVATSFGGTMGATFVWQNTDTAIGLPANGTGNLNFLSSNSGMIEMSQITIAPELNGCTGDSFTFNIIINPLPFVDDPANQNVCSGSTVDIPLTGFPGTTFNWTNSNIGIGLPATGSGNISFTTPTVASPIFTAINITPVLNGCVGPLQQVLVSVSPIPTVTPQADIAVCSGAIPTITFNGTVGATFSWTNSDTAVGIPASGTGNFTFTAPPVNGLQSSTIFVTPLQNGCAGTPDTFMVSVDQAIAVISASDTTLCGGETAVLSASGGVSYLWSTSTNTNSITVTPTITTNYTVTATSAQGCTDTESITVDVLTGVSAIITGDTLICEGDSTTITASGGSTYSWNTGSTSPAITVSPNINTIYQVIAASGPGCSDTTSVMVIVAPGVSTSVSGDTLVCSGDTLALIATGSGNFLWSSGENTPTILIAPISSSVYSVTITSADGCTDADTLSITVSQAVSAVIAGDTIICVGESTTLTATGGAAYLWNTMATGSSISVSPTNTTNYGVLVTDGACSDSAFVTVLVGQEYTLILRDTSCNPADTGTVVQNLMTSLGCDSVITMITVYSPIDTTFLTDTTCIPSEAGIFTEVIPAVSGCDSVIVNTVIFDAGNCAPKFTLTSVPPACTSGNDGSISIIVQSGELPLSYSWTGPGGISGSGPITGLNTPVPIQNLSAGSYTITITGGNGQTAIQSTVLTTPTPVIVTINQISFNGFAIRCAGDSSGIINATATGGIAPITYQWDNGSTTPTLANLPAGMYSVTATDNVGCTATASVEIEEPEPLVFSVTLQQPTCGATQGSLIPLVSGGVSPYEYQVDGQSTGDNLPNLDPGNYLISIVDDNDCSVDTAIQVLQAQELLIQLPADTTINQGSEISIPATTNVVSWDTIIWQPLPVATDTCNQCLTRTFAPLQTVRIRVTLVDTAGCTASDEMLILVDRRTQLYVPNAFSPNGDGTHDEFLINAGPSVRELSNIFIYDRWGDQVYAWDEPIEPNSWPGWDGKVGGKPVEMGVYVYFLRIKTADGEEIVVKGDITVTNR